MTFNLAFIYTHALPDNSSGITSSSPLSPYVVINDKKALYRSNVTFDVEIGGSIKVEIAEPTDLYDYSRGKSIPYSIHALFFSLIGE